MIWIFKAFIEMIIDYGIGIFNMEYRLLVINVTPTFIYGGGVYRPTVYRVTSGSPYVGYKITYLKVLYNVFQKLTRSPRSCSYLDHGLQVS